METQYIAQIYDFDRAMVDDVATLNALGDVSRRRYKDDGTLDFLMFPFDMCSQNRKDALVSQWFASYLQNQQNPMGINGSFSQNAVGGVWFADNSMQTRRAAHVVLQTMTGMQSDDPVWFEQQMEIIGFRIEDIFTNDEFVNNVIGACRTATEHDYPNVVVVLEARNTHIQLHETLANKNRI
ncbi:hypothetical protein SARC_06424 [Sphaeroforma arctica JP610]|uniref:Uncharacterized protein n=1 Tax=Sphaeroforma arctica JP610 TaxID=667725 RepID=A0A0L0FX79_9EUKA|nr:hypothetical protein SARC_06424 [Sphaeroforma arctica JP610]KNC81249.1 hypothetical protein SARC_06424 [Sphaeroforma arctica JP610]|eukprot:XP_014155151.1 hypothetical protein SARC_06424 [Sphaeroforma arctica JP610]